ncbi:hypothetical protein M885DRAFT_483123 [Pelagophyceae sp. CCMP2097]|nr:hypothetical protein M885DRAFT_483123 [Pelagophyceae sp. CCMP2097]|mmetsp:Transcript_19934/g.67502  ORF Transcript_19934/g.67502 Transcript_19934/m.67502 type:complete len:283 (+) Transcript_19934:79-927(+)
MLCLRLLVLLWAVITDAVVVTFHNELDYPVTISWVVEGGDFRLAGKAQPHDAVALSTVPGHAFSYAVDGARRSYIATDKEDQFQIIARTTIKVKCTVRGQKDSFDVHVVPNWSPRGAYRFLELVRHGYFDGMAITRVVPKFLAQFGISRAYEQRTVWRGRTIPDDEDPGVPFKVGMLAFAGSGPHSRTTEVFVVMPDTPAEQLAHFGTNPWETPFGHVTRKTVEAVLPKFTNQYGDMPPWGKGPNPHRIYEFDGYEHLHHTFPELSYFETCNIMPPAFSAEL